MCSLCGTKEEREEESSRLRKVAADLDLFAAHLRGLASGAVKPHQNTYNWRPICRAILREIVEDWL